MVKLNQLFLATLLTSTSYGIDLSDTVFDKAGKKYNIDPLLIYSVALAESAYERGNGHVSPWPWTLRSKNGAHYALTRSESEDELAELIQDHGNNVDVGWMQISLRWHRNKAATPSHLLNPETNVMIGAKILKEAIDSSPNDYLLGVGRYHHWRDKDRARKYADRVLSIYNNIVAISKSSS